MPKYMLSVHPGPATAPAEPPGEEAMAAHMAAVAELEADMRAEGTWVFSARMADPSSAIVVDATAAEVLTTDGPFVEGREHLGGFYLIDADDLDEALRWGTRTSSCIGMPIEVWPLADFAT